MTNKIANRYWESTLTDESLFKRLRDDDVKLREFIYDKYSRRRYTAKGKCPMTLLYEGKSIEPEK